MEIADKQALDAIIERNGITAVVAELVSYAEGKAEIAAGAGHHLSTVYWNNIREALTSVCNI